MVYSTVRDDTHPHLVIGEHPEVQPWAHGKMFNIRSRSTFLRFSSRGFEYSNAHIHALPKESKWHPQTCTPAPNALCQEILSPAKQLWFPDSVVDVPDDWSQIPQTDITRLVNETRACISTDSQRTINTLDTRYEISLCDLIDSNLNIIYAHDPIDKTPTIHWAQDTTSMYEYFIIAVIALYLVSSVSQNIADMFKIAHDIVAYLDDEIKQTKKQNKLQRIKTRSKKNIHDDDPDNDPDNTDNDEDTNDNEDDEDDDDFDNNNTKKKQKSREKQNKRREEIKLKARKMFTTNTPMYRIQSACIFATFIYTVVNFNFMKRDILISTPDYTLYWHIAIYIILTLGFHWCCARDDDKPRSNQITPFPTFPNEMTDYPPSLPTFLPIPENQMLSLSLRSISVPEMSLMGDRLLPIDMRIYPCHCRPNDTQIYKPIPTQPQPNKPQHLKNAGIPGFNISLIIATLLFLSLKIHHTFDNPYIYFLSILLGWRTVLKLFMCQSDKPLHILFSFIDLFLFFSVLANGVSQTSSDQITATIDAGFIVGLSTIAAVVTADLFNLIIEFIQAGS